MIDCRFVNNRTTKSNSGPAAWNGDSSPTFFYCLVTGNNSNPTITVVNCTITNKSVP